MSDERSEAEQRTSEDEERSAQSESDETGKDEGPGGDQEQASSGDGEQASSGDGEQASSGDGESSEEIDETEDPKAVVQKLEEEGPPEKLEDWPGGKAKYRTMGGSEQDAGYDEGATSKLGPSEVRHMEDGSVKVSGETVDNPEDFKGDPIPGGPTDPNSPDQPGERDLEQGRESEDSGDTESEDSDEAKDSSEG